MSKQNCRMAAIQMVSGPRVVDNLAVAGRLIADAVAQGWRNDCERLESLRV